MAIYKESVEALAKVFGQNEAEQLINIAFEDGLGIGRIERLTKNPVLSDEQSERINLIKIRLLHEEPIQQIVGKAQFYGHEFLINKHCLIPRPETEEMVHLIIEENKNIKNALDIGTGSGCIAIALKKGLPTTDLSAIDVSEEALTLARQNSKLNDVTIDFQLLDVLKYALKNTYDLIVSNPPYIPVSDKGAMSKNVLDFEPEVALFVTDDDPLIFYKRIAHLGLRHLHPNGKLYFEIHESYGKQVTELLASKGYRDVRLIQDLNGKDRMVGASI